MFLKHVNNFFEPADLLLPTFFFFFLRSPVEFPTDSIRKNQTQAYKQKTVWVEMRISN